MSSPVSAAQNYRPCCTSPPAQPKPVIPNEAGRLFLPLSLLRKGRPADVRNLSCPRPLCELCVSAFIYFLFWCSKRAPHPRVVVSRKGGAASRALRPRRRDFDLFLVSNFCLLVSLSPHTPRQLLRLNRFRRRKLPVDVRIHARLSGMQQTPHPHSHPARRAGNRRKLFRG
jgi:hypothetical protein